MRERTSSQLVARVRAAAFLPGASATGPSELGSSGDTPSPGRPHPCPSAQSPSADSEVNRAGIGAEPARAF
jgi:hypothetical protein